MGISDATREKRVENLAQAGNGELFEETAVEIEGIVTHDVALGRGDPAVRLEGVDDQKIPGIAGIRRAVNPEDDSALDKIQQFDFLVQMVVTAGARVALVRLPRWQDVVLVVKEHIGNTQQFVLFLLGFFVERFHHAHPPVTVVSALIIADRGTFCKDLTERKKRFGNFARFNPVGFV